MSIVSRRSVTPLVLLLDPVGCDDWFWEVVMVVVTMTMIMGCCAGESSGHYVRLLPGEMGR
jgi:hypothetical protein